MKSIQKKGKKMSENNKTNFIGYEYRDVTVNRNLKSIYMDSYQNFGWKLEKTSEHPLRLSSVTMKFKRDRKIGNKAELTRLQRQFDSCVHEITNLEDSKASSASIVAFSAGIIGTAFLAGATFSFLASLVILCIILAIPGFIGWIIPYFLYNSTYEKKNTKIMPLVDRKYDEIYEICERANGLL